MDQLEFREARDAVARALEAAGIVGAVHVEAAGAGQRNAVWMATSTKGSFVVRLLADDSRRAMEEAIIDRAAAAGVPVAEVVWSCGEPRPVMVQRRLRGQRLADVDATDALCQDVARTLRSIHRIPVGPGCGNLRSDLTGATPKLSTWFVDHVGPEVANAAGTPEDRRLLEEGLDRLEAARPFLDAVPCGLAHGDVQPFNLLVDGDRISGVVDWEAAKAGPVAFDFGWWDWFSDAWGTPWPTDQLLAAYDPDGALDREQLDESRRLVVARVWLR